MKYWTIFIVFIFMSFQMASASVTSKKVRYKTVFGDCPSRSAGSLALRLMKTFEATKSLKDLKKQIIDEKLDRKYFLSDYKIKYDPVKKSIKFNFECPKPLMKVQVYKETENDSYEAILVQNGKLFDPTYEILLKEDKKLTGVLPSLALPVELLDKSVQNDISALIESGGAPLISKLSEVILDKEGSLTMILSLKGRPSSVFMGDGDWGEKIKKLKKIIGYMESQNKIPAVINLINSKKVVVKFSDTI